MVVAGLGTSVSPTQVVEAQVMVASSIIIPGEVACRWTGSRAEGVQLVVEWAADFTEGGLTL